jgi:hypothetical protein
LALSGQYTNRALAAIRRCTIRYVDQVDLFGRGRLVEQGGDQALRDNDDSRLGPLAAT